MQQVGWQQQAPGTHPRVPRAWGRRVLRCWLLLLLLLLLLQQLLLLLLLPVLLVLLAACRGRLQRGQGLAGAQATAASRSPAQPSSRCALQAGNQHGNAHTSEAGVH